MKGVSGGGSGCVRSTGHLHASIDEHPADGDKEVFERLERELTAREIISVRKAVKDEVSTAQENMSGVWRWLGYGVDVSTQLDDDVQDFLSMACVTGGAEASGTGGQSR